jgi:hypothetical protein
MARDYTTIIELEDAKLRVEYSYEPFDSYEYSQTGHGGGIEIYKITAADKEQDLSCLLMLNSAYTTIEERILEMHENEYE